jgi:hypothetical protein
MSVIHSHATRNEGSSPSTATAAPSATPDSLTPSDVAALEAFVPTLKGKWLCQTNVDDDGDLSAVVARRDDWQRRNCLLVVRKGAWVSS